MKKQIILVASAFLLAGSLSWADTVHQRVSGSSAHKGDGSKAVVSGVMETKIAAKAEVARVTAAMNQWGYVNYWMGLKTPPGAAIIRVCVYNTGEPAADYAIYIAGASKDPIGKLVIPRDAPLNSLVDVDVSVDLPQEWSGIILKKFSADTLPSPWIESVSVILPN